MRGGATLTLNPAPAPSKVTSLFVRVTFFGAFRVIVVSAAVSASAVFAPGDVDAEEVSVGRNCGAMTSKATGRAAPKLARFAVDLDSVVVSEVVMVEEEEEEEEEEEPPTFKTFGFGELIVSTTPFSGEAVTDI